MNLAAKPPRLPQLRTRLLVWILGALVVVWASFVYWAYQTGIEEADELTDGHLAGVAALVLNIPDSAQIPAGLPTERVPLRSSATTVPSARTSRACCGTCSPPRQAAPPPMAAGRCATPTMRSNSRKCSGWGQPVRAWTSPARRSRWTL